LPEPGEGARGPLGLRTPDAVADGALAEELLPEPGEGARGPLELRTTDAAADGALSEEISLTGATAARIARDIKTAGPIFQQNCHIFARLRQGCFTPGG